MTTSTSSSIFFFFSSRRRHTRWPRDWSSDVCSSDLEEDAGEDVNLVVADELPVLRDRRGRVSLGVLLEQLDLAAARLVVDLLQRQLEAVEHVLAGLGEDRGKGPEVSDTDRVGGDRRARRE